MVNFIPQQELQYKMTQRIYFRLDWRDYFKTTSNQMKKMKKDDIVRVYQRLYKEVLSASNKKQKEHLIALDDNTRTVMSVSQLDYTEVLTICKDFLEKNEDYESCAAIRDALVKLETKKPKRKNKEPEKLVLIKRI
jgi:protein-arginine kinase activator protein McsA